MALRMALVTDMHFGPLAYFEGKLRKLSHQAPELLAGVVEQVRQREGVDWLVNLGDNIEDEGRGADLARYNDCQRVLRGAGVPVLNVAGNHDTVHLTADDLNAAWGRQGPLHYAVDAGPLRLVVLHSIERKDIDVRVDEGQLEWLRAELARDERDALVFVHHSASEQELEDSRWFSKAPHLALIRERAALRSILRESGVVRAVFNGHLHRSHLDVIDGIPYVTFQSLIENLDDDAPGRPASAYAVVTVDERRVVVRGRGQEPVRYQIERG